MREKVFTAENAVFDPEAESWTQTRREDAERKQSRGRENRQERGEEIWRSGGLVSQDRRQGAEGPRKCAGLGRPRAGALAWGNGDLRSPAKLGPELGHAGLRARHPAEKRQRGGNG
jgi:hypothetical protein